MKSIYSNKNKVTCQKDVNIDLNIYNNITENIILYNKSNDILDILNQYRKNVKNNWVSK